MQQARAIDPTRVLPKAPGAKAALNLVRRELPGRHEKLALLPRRPHAVHVLDRRRHALVSVVPEDRRAGSAHGQQV